MSRCKLTAKDLRNRVEIFHAVRSSDGMGGFTRAWESQGVAAGKLERASARDERTGEKLGAAQTAVLWLRRQISVPEETRVVVDGQEYDTINYDPAGPGENFIKVYLRKPEDKRDG